MNLVLSFVTLLIFMSYIENSIVHIAIQGCRDFLGGKGRQFTSMKVALPPSPEMESKPSLHTTLASLNFTLALSDIFPRKITEDVSAIYMPAASHSTMTYYT